MKRRELLLGIGLASVAAPLYTRTARAGADCDDASEHMANMLFVQTAHGAELLNGILRLKTVSPATLFFSDRPDRITGHEPTKDFIDNWDEGDDSFKSDPPNATLSIVSGPEPQEIVVILKSPRLDNGDLLYDVDILDGAQQATGSASSLFIDTVGRPLTPVSVAGVHRRERRRRVDRRH
jgi:hypothetical protein